MLAIGDIVRCIIASPRFGGIRFDGTYFITEVHDGGLTVSIEGLPGRFLAWRFEKGETAQSEDA